ncbi:hypothetical protein HII36_17440 [Nonomuraea sp. NN258]|uniref:hypothetical protein n=1 Tax=Nonomuraea antri TaxID=2730852 RepID=UPI001568E804|nr:hypothetical protein [Nonomuraea antri]NRQ33620.1 hypothetical protein [Nonomuraea antri]
MNRQFLHGARALAVVATTAGTVLLGGATAASATTPGGHGCAFGRCYDGYAYHHGDRGILSAVSDTVMDIVDGRSLQRPGFFGFF